MEYVAPEIAQKMPGLRLALTIGVPGPWSEAAKSIFYVKKLDFVPVRQIAAESNDALVAWTGHRNAPQVMYEDEPPRIRWEEIVMLAERLSDEPSLIPSAPRDRALMFGLCHEIASEDGLAWNRRHQLLAPMLTAPDAATNPALESGRVIGANYGFSLEALERANGRINQVLGLLSEQLATQKQAGHDYLVGDRLSAVDIYWATFCAMVDPLPHELNPMPEPMRAGYSGITPETAEVLDPALLAHRDRIYERHLQLPLDF